MIAVSDSDDVDLLLEESRALCHRTKKTCVPRDRELYRGSPGRWLLPGANQVSQQIATMPANVSYQSACYDLLFHFQPPNLFANMSFVAHPKQTHSEKGILRNIIQPACLHAKLLQLYLTLCNPMDYNPPGSSVHGISQARILEWVAISFSRGSF